MARIEADTTCRAWHKWHELYPENQPSGLFVAKVDVSKIQMSELKAAFERQLFAHGYGLYIIDYIQDFSCVLDRETPENGRHRRKRRVDWWPLHV